MTRQNELCSNSKLCRALRSMMEVNSKNWQPFT
jgi:hypothetical protein